MTDTEYTCTVTPTPKYGRRVTVHSPNSFPMPTRGTPHFETDFLFEDVLTPQEFVNLLGDEYTVTFQFGVDNPEVPPEGIYRNRGYLQHLLYSQQAAVGVPHNTVEAGVDLVRTCFTLPLDVFIEVRHTTPELEDD